MLQELQKQIVDGLAKAKEQGQLTADDVYNTVKNSVIHSTEDLKEGVRDVKKVSSEAVRSSVQTLQEGGEASRDKIAAAVNGAIDGIKQAEQDVVAETQKEVSKHTEKLHQERDKLALALRDSLDSTKEVAGEFSDEIREDIESAVADVKLQMTELLGVTREAVKDAVKKAIDSGSKVDETIHRITRDATVTALNEAKFTAERARKVSETVLSAAVEATEETGQYVKETAAAAVEGVREGLGIIITQTQNSISRSGKEVSDYTAHELRQARDGLESVGDLFIETIRKVADRSGEVAKNILYELAEDAQKVGSSLREMAAKAAQTATDGLKELGSETLELGEKAAHSVAEEASELGSRMVNIAKGAAVGMWEGAKKTIWHEDKKLDETKTSEKKDS